MIKGDHAQKFCSKLHKCRDSLHFISRADVAKEIEGGQAKLAFLWVDDQSMAAQMLNKGPKVHQMVSCGVTGQQIVTQMDEQKRQVLKDIVHEPLERL